jgi:hypothetical protein
VNVAPLAGILTIFLVAVTPAWAADNLLIERLATCQDSWLDWKKSDPIQLKNHAESFQSDFSQKKDPFFVPKSNQIVAGLPVAQVFPESIGMAVRFSVMVNANLTRPKRAWQKGSASHSVNANLRATTCALASWRLARRKPFC